MACIQNYKRGKYLFLIALHLFATAIRFWFVTIEISNVQTSPVFTHIDRRGPVEF